MPLLGSFSSKAPLILLSRRCCCRLRSIERASLAAATAAPSLALPIEPVPLPPLLQSNFLSVSLPTNVSEFAGVADFNQTQAGSNRCAGPLLAWQVGQAWNESAEFGSGKIAVCGGGNGFNPCTQQCVGSNPST